MLGSYPLVAGLTAVFVFVVLAQRGLETVWVLYTGHKFGWDEQANGLSLDACGGDGRDCAREDWCSPS